MNVSYEDYPSVLRDYFFYIRTIKGRSQRTVDGYAIDLRGFCRFLLKQRGLFSDCEFSEIPIDSVTVDLLKTVTLSDAYEYLHFVSDSCDNLPKTRARKVSALKSFFHYLSEKSHLIDYNPLTELEVPAVKKSLPKYLTLEQCYALLSNIDGEFRERDYCMTTLLLNCGMRLSELVSINCADIHENTLKLLGKGNKERIVYLNDACLSAIEAYLPIRAKLAANGKEKHALFLNRRGTRIGARRVEQIIEAQLAKAGLSQYGFSVHKLRHTAATIMYQYGHVDIRILQEILGHANLGTTQIYTHISDDQMEKASKSTPLSNLKPPSPALKKASAQEEAEPETQQDQMDEQKTS